MQTIYFLQKEKDHDAFATWPLETLKPRNFETRATKEKATNISVDSLYLCRKDLLSHTLSRAVQSAQRGLT